jgi:hypothetical protein
LLPSVYFFDLVGCTFLEHTSKFLARQISELHPLKPSQNIPSDFFKHAVMICILSYPFASSFHYTQLKLQAFTRKSHLQWSTFKALLIQEKFFTLHSLVVFTCRSSRGTSFRIRSRVPHLPMTEVELHQLPEHSYSLSATHPNHFNTSTPQPLCILTPAAILFLNFGHTHGPFQLPPRNNSISPRLHSLTPCIQKTNSDPDLEILHPPH